MATYADILRARNQAQLAGQQANIFSQLAQSAGPSVTPAGQVQGMQGMTSPTPQYVNYGNILQQGLGNFLAMHKSKEALEKESEAKDLNNQFLQETVGNDPQAQKLVQMAQVGLPGAAERLTDYIQPKRQAIGAFLQAAPGLDPESAAALAPQFGISPEFGARIASSSYNRMMEAQQRAQGFAIEKEVIKGSIPKQPTPTDPNKVVPGFGGLTQGELMQMSPEERAARFGSAAWAGKQTQQQKELEKMGAAAMAEIAPTQQAIDMADRAINLAGKASFFPGQGGLMGPWANRLLANNPANAELRAQMSQLALAAAGGKLGGQVSDSDVKLIYDGIAKLDEGDRNSAIRMLTQFRSNMAGKKQSLENRMQKGGYEGGYQSLDDMLKEIGYGQ